MKSKSTRLSSACETLCETLPERSGFDSVTPDTPPGPETRESDQRGTVKRSRRRAALRVRRVFRLTAETVSGAVQEFARYLEIRFPERYRNRPAQLKSRVIAQIKQQLPPYPRSFGRPQKASITKATTLFKQQKGKQMSAGTRSDVDWVRIAWECIPGFAAIRSDYRRRDEMRKLKWAVHKRVERMAKRGAGPMDKPPSPSS